MHLTTAALAALTATSTLALPTIKTPLHPRSTNNGTFTLLATNANNTAVANQQIHANAGGLYINRPTCTYCPSGPGVACTVFSNATVLEASGTGTLGMAVAVPGGQSVYVAKDGDVKFTAAHGGAVPKVGLTDLFLYTSDYGVDTFGSLKTVEPGVGFVACPVEDGSWKVKVVLEGRKHAEECVGMTIATYVFDGEGAWEYE